MDHADANRLSQRSRVQYKPFHGCTDEDPDEWLEDFEGMAAANGESLIKMQILQGMFKGEARPWWKGLNADQQASWDQFKPLFVKEFRPIGASELAMRKLSQLQYREGTSFRKSVQRFQKLVRRTKSDASDEMQLQWLVNALPRKMSFAVRKENPRTTAKAIECTHLYINTDITSRKKHYSSQESSSDEDTSSKKKKKKSKKKS